MNITELNPVFGAQIDGVDLSTIDDDDFEKVFAAFSTRSERVEND